MEAHEVHSPAAASVFEIRERLFAGGDWELFEARQLSTGQLGLIRILQAEASLERRHHFLSRARLFMELALAGFASILAFGELPDGRVYLFTEGCAAELLLLQQSPSQQITLAMTIDCAEQLAQIVERAFIHGILFLDLRPDVVLWTRSPINAAEGSRIHIRIIPGDTVRFLRRASSFQSTLSDERFGPVLLAMHPYQPEEQRSGSRELGDRVLVYALGAVLYTAMYQESPPLHPSHLGPVKLAEDLVRAQLLP